MRAWTRDADSKSGLSLREVEDPSLLPDQLLVRVEAFAPNPGDLAAIPTSPQGSIPGWDGAGTVLHAAADGKGPRVGDRVVFLGVEARGWAERRAVSRALTAAAPVEAPWEQLAMIPVPATSALRALRKLGSVLGRRVLIVGASGAVGRIAVQLAARSGAQVVAVARDERAHEELQRLGAAETHKDLSTVAARVHGAIDMIGGQHLVTAYGLLEADATIIALGHSAGADEHFPYGAFIADHTTSGRSISTFFLGSEPDLDREMSYLAADDLLEFEDVDVRSWTELSTWVAQGAPRTTGRVVFRVD